MKDPIDYLYKARLRGIVYPNGKTGKGNKWHPSDEEQCSCCKSIREPSRAYPWSLMTHCRSKNHIRTLAEENPTYFQSLFHPDMWDILNHPENMALHVNSTNEAVQRLIQTEMKKVG